MKVEKSVTVIIVSNAKTNHLYNLTRQAIEGAKANDINTNVIVVESNRSVEYNGCTVFWPNGEFNYNAYLNQGASLTPSDYICFSNNDVVFSSNWADKLVEKLNQGYGSAAPYCPRYHSRVGITSNISGYKVGKIFPGWCFMLTKKSYKKICGLSENYKYWCSDNIVSKQLEDEGIKHILVYDSKVTHLNDQTGQLLDAETKKQYTWEQALKFEQDTGRKLFSNTKQKANE